MLVVICDDDEIFRNQLKKLLLEYKHSSRIHLDIIEFSNGKELLTCPYKYDIAFLDYEMPELNGLETARILRKRKNLCCVMFLTSYPQYVFDSFEVNTYRYLVKPLKKEKLNRALDDYIKEKKMMSPIVVNCDGEQLTINSEDISYLEADGKFCNIRTQQNFVRSSKTLSKIFEMLPQHCFYRTHKSYAVNFYCVRSVKNNLITLNSGEKVKLSRNQVVNFKNAYRNFIKHYIVRM